jgi:prepilin-type N-terminal cleavage/methylation domain-containing protein
MRSDRRRRGFSLIELLIVIAIILVIAAIAVPKANQLLMSANETAVINEIGTLHKAELQYYSQFNRYAISLNELGPPTSGAPGPAGADLIPKTLAEGKKSGYVFTLTATQTGYAINANPERFGSTGRKTFYSDQTLLVRANNSAEPANANSPENAAAVK